MKSTALRHVSIACLALLTGAAHAATWTPMTTGTKPRAVELTTATTFAVPPSVAARGGVMRFLLVGGGEGGHASKSNCDDYAVQGGRGGDGGEVIELELAMQPGQCTGGFGVVIGAAGKGAFRGSNQAAQGEPGASTVLSCGGTTLALALGGGKRPDASTAAKSAKGGIGGVVMNTLDSAGDMTASKQRSMAIEAAGDGQDGRGGYGSGGAGGGASVAVNGSSVRPDGTVVSRATVRNAPVGKAGYGAGAGAGPNEYGTAAASFAAENAAQYGAGGGGGAASCGVPVTARDGGHGYQGLMRIQWFE